MKKEIFSRPAFHLILIVILGVLVYSNTFEVPFQLDDQEYIADNPAMTDFGYFIDPSEIDGFKTLYFGVRRCLKTRYVAYLTFWANYKIGGTDVTGYHIVNAAVHVINGLLVYMIVALTFKTPFMTGLLPRISFKFRGEGGSCIALFSALLFVAHPVQTMAVTYILQRWASLAAMFYMLTIVLYIRWRLGAVQSAELEVRRNSAAASSLWYITALLSCVLAMKTKENAFTLPLMIALYEFLFFSTAHSSLNAEKIRSKGRRILYLVPFLSTMLIIPYSYISLNIDAGEVSAVLNRATRIEDAIPRKDYFISQFGVITTYIRILFLPVGQSMYYDDMIHYSFTDPDVFMPFLFLLGVFGVGIYCLVRSSGHRVQRRPQSSVSSHLLRLSAFGIFWFFLALSVESSVLSISDVINEYRAYLPSAGAFMAVVSGAFYLAGRFGKRERKAAACTACVAVLVLSGAAYARNTVWHSGIGLWEDTVKKAPGNASGYYWLGIAYKTEGLLKKAIETYKDCIKQNPYYAGAHNNLGTIYQSKGIADKAMEQYRTAAALDPWNPTSYYNLGVIYQRRGLTDNAIQLYQIALKVAPYHVEAHNNLGIAYMSRGMVDKAIEHYRTALELMPDYAQAHYNLGLVYLELELKKKALGEFETALSIDPDYIKARELMEEFGKHM